MAHGGTFYRCHLFSFGGPQTEGVISRWTQNLVPVGERKVLSGEKVELYVAIEANVSMLTDQSRVRFDVLEEDHLLTGGLDDRIVSFVGTGASEPEEGFSVRRRTTVFHQLEPGQSAQDFADRFKLSHPADYSDHVLIMEEQGSEGSLFHVLTWWAAERLEDHLNSEFYFVVNVDETVEDQSTEVLDVSPNWAPGDAEVLSSLLEPVFPALTEARWEATQAAPGAEVRLVVEGSGLAPGMDVSVEILEGSPGEIVDATVVDAFDFTLTGLDPYETTWRLPAIPSVDSYRFRTSLFGQEIDSRNRLDVLGTLRALITTPGGKTLPHTPYRIIDTNDEVVRAGVTNASGQITEKNLPPSADRLEIDNALIESVVEPVRRETAPAFPPAAGRMFSFVLLPPGATDDS